MTRHDLRRDFVLAGITAALLTLPLLALGQAVQQVPTQPAPADSPVPATPDPDATGITPQGIMGTTPTQPPLAGTPPAPPGDTPAATRAVPIAAETSGLEAGQRASHVIGKTIRGADDENIGTIDDLLLPQGGGQPVAILSVGGFLGIGARRVAVPYDRFTRPTGADHWTLRNATRDSLMALPAFTYPENDS